MNANRKIPKIEMFDLKKLKPYPLSGVKSGSRVVTVPIRPVYRRRLRACKCALTASQPFI